MDSPDDSSPTPVSVRSLFGDAIIYGQLEVFDKFIGFVLLPITTALLTPADYGVLSLFGSSTYIVLVMFALGLPQGFLRHYTEQSDGAALRQTVATTFWTMLIWSVVWLALMTIWARPLSHILFDADNPMLTVLLGLVGLLSVIETLGRHRLQVDGRPFSYGCISIISIIATRGLSLAFMIVGWGAIGWIVGKTLGLFVTVVLFARYALGDISLQWDRSTFRIVLPYGLALVPGLLSHWFMVGCDKYLLRALVEDPLEQIGFYTVGERISAIMGLITVAFLLGWRRFAFRNMHHPDGPHLLAKGMFWFVVGAGYAAMSLSLLGDDLTHWVIPSRYEAGIQVIPTLTLAGLFSGLAELASVGLYHSKRGVLLSTLNILAALLNLLLGLWLIPHYGILAAAATTCFCQGLKGALIWRASQREFAIPFPYRRAAAFAGLFLTVYLAGDLAQPLGWVAATLIQAALVAAVPLVLWSAGFVASAEKASARHSVELVLMVVRAFRGRPFHLGRQRTRPGEWQPPIDIDPS